MAFTAGFGSRTSLHGLFDINGNQCTVALTPDALTWTPADGKDEEEVVIPIEEILSATLSTEESNSPSKSVIQLVYIEHHENNVLGRAGVSLKGTTDICTIWSRHIQECIGAVPGRPKRALVVINPVSGDKEGPELYREKVAPVFKEASVKTHVIISESADHVKEIIGGYDLTSIDCIVTMGGDGIYHIVADALLQRQMKEADLDLNDPDTEIPENCLPIGIIPCGSGNLIAFQLFGTVDIESIALGIVKGGRQNLPVQGVWSGGELVVYSFIIVSLGALADWMNEAQGMRDKGARRYHYLLDQYTLKESARSLDVSIETRAPIITAQSNTTDTGNRDQASGKATPTRQPWMTSYQGPTPMVTAFTSDYAGVRESKDVSHLDFTRLFILKEWKGSLFKEHMKQLVGYDPAILHMDTIEHIPCTEYNITVNNPAEQGWQANMVKVDGEIYFGKEPGIHVKLFPGKVNLCASASADFIVNNSPSIF